MKIDKKKALYESIMTSVAKEVKKALNEDFINEDLAFEEFLNNNEDFSEDYDVIN